MNSMTSIVGGLFSSVPLFIAVAVGLGYAIAQKDRAPRVAVAVSAGAGLILLAMVGSPFAHGLANLLLGPVLRNNVNQMVLLFQFMNFVASTIQACGVGALIYAAFLDRAGPLVGGYPQAPKPWG
jgi:hypothetical protein